MDIPHHIGPYAILRLLGEGGSAYVYLAYDPRLERRVALKVLKLPSPDWVVRLKHEAMLQARLHHPNIAQIYDVGEADGRTFLAMQYIPGSTFGEAAPTLSLDTRVRLLAQVADAVHTAHRQGLIHRDLKPGNLLLAKDEAGQPWPYVVDFGLACLWEGQSLTAPGQILGSPSYMAPEQAQGRAIDPRTDVYGLGATFFELLVGHAPFLGKDAVSVLMKVVQEEAPPIADLNPDIPSELAAIVHRCLEKDPARRYPSAAHLRDDLHRFLDGEPVLARPLSVVRKVLRWIDRNRVLAGVTATSALALAILGSALVHARWSTVRRARIAEELGQIVSEIDGTLQKAYLLPTHDVAPEKAVVRARLLRVQELEQQGGRLAAGPAALALGRGHLALGEYAQARLHLERARAAGVQGPELTLALGVTCANLYILGVRALDPKDTRKREALEREFRSPALQHLKALQGLSASLPAPFLEGLLAICESRYDEAVARAREAVVQSPFFLEGICLEGDAEFGRALEELWAGRYASCEEALQRAEAAYKRAIEIGRSYPPGYQKLGTRWQLAFNCAWLSGGEVQVQGFRALEVLEQAIRVDSTAAAPWATRSVVQARLAEREGRQGRDPSPGLNEAQAAARRALELDPVQPGALESAATLSMIKGDLLQRRGEDPRPAFEEGERWGLKLLEVDPSNWGMRKNLGLAQARIGDWLSRRGLDGEGAYRRGAEHCRGAVGQAESGLTYWNLAAVLGAWALARHDQGLDAGAVCSEALTTYRRGIALSPSILGIRVDMAEILILQGRIEDQAGRDPEPAWREAETLLSEIIGKKLPDASSDLMAARLALARAQRVASRQDPTARRAAEAAAHRAVGTNAKDAEAWLVLARAATLESGAAGKEKALHHLSKARALSPLDPLLQFEEARLLAAGENPSRSKRDLALALLERVLKANPAHRDALALQAQLSKN